MGQSHSARLVPNCDDLFEALTKPHELKAYLLNSKLLSVQVELLCGTLRVDASLLKVTEVGESFDTATFCLGQLVSHEPQLMSELPFATTVVDGLASALQVGAWPLQRFRQPCVSHSWTASPPSGCRRFFQQTWSEIYISHRREFFLRKN